MKAKGIKEWKEEFYTDVKGAKKWSDRKCFEHTLKKYQGQLKTSLNRYRGLTVNDYRTLSDGIEEIQFTSETCSLCKKYYKKVGHDCSECPIEKSTKLRCGKDRSEYNTFFYKKDPRPMVKLMKKLISECDETGKWKNSKS